MKLTKVGVHEIADTLLALPYQNKLQLNAYNGINKVTIALPPQKRESPDIKVLFKSV